MTHATPRQFPASMDTFTDWMQDNGYGPNTVEQRGAFFDRLVREWAQWPTHPREVAAWLDSHNGWTRRTYHSHLICVYRWLVETGQVPESPMARVAVPPRPHPRPRPLRDEEVARILTAAADDARLTAWLLLGLLAGLRAHEMAKMAGQDIDDRGLWVVGKGGQAAMIPTDPRLWELAQSYPRHGWWFPSREGGHVTADRVSQAVRAHFRALGLPGSIHRTRATYATGLLRGGANIKVIQRLMRHRHLSSTEHYLGSNEADELAALASLPWAA